MRYGRNGATSLWHSYINCPFSKGVMPIIANTASGPTAPARIGTITRKPLPKIEASGVLVASISFLIP